MPPRPSRIRKQSGVPPAHYKGGRQARSGTVFLGCATTDTVARGACFSLHGTAIAGAGCARGPDGRGLYQASNGTRGHVGA